MSQSPDEEGRAEAGYLDAWGDLANRIRQGNSFSGREPNCFFLSTGAASGSVDFADVSAGSGLDHSDDSRAVALVDWDQDGDLDLWYSNRTGPRFRFLRNNLPRPASSIALRLEGNPRRGINRDAIGARVELRLQDGQRLYRTVTFGNGFLSQSSRWLHFGLPDGVTIDEAVIRWPGGETETIADLASGGRYRIRYGTSLAVRDPDRPPIDLPTSNPSPEPLSEQGIVRLSRPVPFPALQFRGFDGEESSLPATGLQWISLWASWCQPCLDELREISERHEELPSLQLVALNVDGIQGEAPEASRVKKTLRDLGYRGDAGFANAASIEALERVMKGLLYRVRQMPLPVSFLVDEGQIVAIYKGRVSLEDLQDDLAHQGVDAAQRKSRSVPFSGRWGSDSFRTHPIAVASTFLSGGYYEEARQHLEKFLRENPEPAQQDPRWKRQAADVYQTLARVARAAGQTEEAVAHYRTALVHRPDLLPAVAELALLRMAEDSDESLALLEGALKRVPGHPDLRTKWGTVREHRNEDAQAVVAYQEALKIEARWIPAAERLAWIRSTSKDESVRNNAEASQLAALLAAQGGMTDPRSLDIMAAVHANQGQFDKAIELTTAAKSLARKQGLDELLKGISERETLYRQGMPFRQ